MTSNLLKNIHMVGQGVFACNSETVREKYLIKVLLQFFHANGESDLFSFAVIKFYNIMINVDYELWNRQLQSICAQSPSAPVNLMDIQSRVVW